MSNSRAEVLIFTHCLVNGRWNILNRMVAGLELNSHRNSFANHINSDEHLAACCRILPLFIPWCGTGKFPTSSKVYTASVMTRFDQNIWHQFLIVTWLRFERGTSWTAIRRINAKQTSSLSRLIVGKFPSIFKQDGEHLSLWNEAVETNLYC